MQQPLANNYPISDLVDWEFSKQLVITPKFQRRDVWTHKAKSYLVDTILRAMPIPPLFMRLRIDPLQRRAIREVVDGQQRLRAILGYIKGEFPILRAHNKEFGGMYYTDLPEEIQRIFLGYKLVVHALEEANDADVLEIFARINTYTVKLNAQELLNAEFFGVFKQTMYQLAHQHYVFWQNNAILTDSQIARMDDAELVSELAISMLGGIQETKASLIREYYERFDDDFPQAEELTEQFEFVINTIADMFNGSLRTSQFRRAPLFYSLFCAIYDAKFGLPGSDRPRIAFTVSENKRIAEELRNLDQILRMEEPPYEYAQFVDATRRRTADAAIRRLRHQFIWDRVFTKVFQPLYAP